MLPTQGSMAESRRGKHDLGTYSETTAATRPQTAWWSSPSRWWWWSPLCGWRKETDNPVSVPDGVTILSDEHPWTCSEGKRGPMAASYPYRLADMSCQAVLLALSFLQSINFNTTLTSSCSEISLATNPFRDPWQKTLATLWCHLWSSTRTGGCGSPPRRTKWHASSWGDSSGLLNYQWELYTQVYVLEALKNPCIGQQVGRGLHKCPKSCQGAPGVYTVRVRPLYGCSWVYIAYKITQRLL